MRNLLQIYAEPADGAVILARRHVALESSGQATGVACVIVNREPDGLGFRVRPVDTVTAMRGDIDEAARSQPPRLCLVFEAQQGFTAEQQYPLIALLVIPLAGRGGVAAGNDPFHPERRAGEKRVESLLAEFPGQVVEQIAPRGTRHRSGPVVSDVRVEPCEEVRRDLFAIDFIQHLVPPAGVEAG